MAKADNVHPLVSKPKATGEPAPRLPADYGGGGGPPGEDPLQARVEKLESTIADVQLRMIKLEAKFDAFASNASTKADLSDLAASFHKSLNEQTWKFVGAATGLAGVFAAISFGLARAIS
jgi:hypothetical protein